MNRVRLLVIVSVLPVVLLTIGANPAAASDTYGPSVPWSMSGVGDTSPGRDSDTLRCNGTSAYHVVSDDVGTPEVTSVGVVGGLKCKIDVSYGNDPDPGDVDFDTSLVFMGAASTGDYCEVSASSGGDLLLGIDYETTVAFEGPGDCAFGTICLTVDGADDGGPFGLATETHWEICKDVDMGDPPAPDPVAVCQYGTPLRTHGDFEFKASNANYYVYEWALKVQNDTTGGNPRYWKHVGYRSPSYGSGDGVTGVSTATADAALFAFPGWDGPRGAGTTATYVSNPDPNGSATFGGGSKPAALTGFDVTVKGADSEQIGNYQRNYTTYPIGVTVPEKCIFWFGPKIVNLPNTDIDEPWAAVDVDAGGAGGEPPDTTPDDPADPATDCNFDVTDPGSWLEAGMCAAVGLLGQILNVLGDILGAIGGIAAAILSGLGSLLSSLFVPSDGFLQAQVEDVKDSWDDTPPIVVKDGLTGVTDAATSADPGSSCSGPLFAFDEPVGHSHVTLRPFDACSGGMATLASIVHTALTVAVYIGAYATGLRMISHTFGVDAGFARYGGQREGLS